MTSRANPTAAPPPEGGGGDERPLTRAEVRARAARQAAADALRVGSDAAPVGAAGPSDELPPIARAARSRRQRAAEPEPGPESRAAVTPASAPAPTAPTVPTAAPNPVGRTASKPEQPRETRRSRSATRRQSAAAPLDRDDAASPAPVTPAAPTPPAPATRRARAEQARRARRRGRPRWFLPVLVAAVVALGVLLWTATWAFNGSGAEQPGLVTGPATPTGPETMADPPPADDVCGTLGSAAQTLAGGEVGAGVAASTDHTATCTWQVKGRQVRAERGPASEWARSLALLAPVVSGSDVATAAQRATFEKLAERSATATVTDAEACTAFEIYAIAKMGATKASRLVIFTPDAGAPQLVTASECTKGVFATITVERPDLATVRSGIPTDLEKALATLAR